MLCTTEVHAEPRDDLVEDQRDAELGAHLPELLEERTVVFERRPRHGFYDHGRKFIGMPGDGFER